MSGHIRSGPLVQRNLGINKCQELATVLSVPYTRDAACSGLGYISYHPYHQCWLLSDRAWLSCLENVRHGWWCCVTKSFAKQLRQKEIINSLRLEQEMLYGHAFCRFPAGPVWPVGRWQTHGHPLSEPNLRRVALCMLRSATWLSLGPLRAARRLPQRSIQAQNYGHARKRRNWAYARVVSTED